MNDSLQTQPIGVFDSGVGGLSVLDVLVERFPNEDFVYLGDTANMPYGSRSHDDIEELTLGHLEWLRTEKGAKFLIVACNTARSALSVSGLELVIDPSGNRPILGPIAPVSRWLSSGSGFQRVGVVATPATVRSNVYEATMGQFSRGEVQVKQIAIEGLARQIETGQAEGDVFENQLKDYVAALVDWQADAVVLGCTHYPHICTTFRKILPNSIAVLDPAKYMADALHSHLSLQGLINPKKDPGSRHFYVSGVPEQFRDVANRLPLDSLKIQNVERKL